MFKHGLLKKTDVQLGKYGKMNRRPVFKIFITREVFTLLICGFLQMRDNLVVLYVNLIHFENFVCFWLYSAKYEKV